MYDPQPGQTFDPVQGPDRTWHRISDFRPGIHTAVAPMRPPGVAKESGTFQCYASTAGSLIPAPRLVQRITPPTLTGAAIDSEQFRVSGIYANAPVYGASDNTTGAMECHTELFLASEYWSGSGELVLTVHRYTRNLNTPTWEQIWQRTYAADTFNPATRPRVCYFASQRSNPSDVDASGPQVVAWVFSGNARAFPANADTYVTGTDPMPGDLVDDPLGGGLVAPQNLVAHGGQVIIYPLYVTGDGDDQVYISSEAAYWTKVNDVTNLSAALVTTGNYFNILGGYEQGTGYGVIASLTADELFMVKVRGGAIILTGSVEDATVRTLQYVQSTGLSFNNGTTTWLGYVYPVDSSGVWLWSGGDTSEQVTKHLTPNFWRPSTMMPVYADPSVQSAAQWGYQNTTCASWNEFALFPNNWFWDTDEMGWWRILDPDYIPIGHWQSDERGVFAWGSPLGWSDDTNPVFYEFSRFYGATYFSWTSHPQNHALDRAVRLDEIVVCAQGEGTVRITISSDIDDAPDDVIDFQFTDASVPVMIRAATNVQGRSHTFQIESWGVDHDIAKGSIDMDADTSAPTVHWVDYSTLPSTQIAQ